MSRPVNLSEVPATWYEPVKVQHEPQAIAGSSFFPVRRFGPGSAPWQGCAHCCQPGSTNGRSSDITACGMRVPGPNMAATPAANIR